MSGDKARGVLGVCRFCVREDPKEVHRSDGFGEGVFKNMVSRLSIFPLKYGISLQLIEIKDNCDRHSQTTATLKCFLW